MRKVLLSIICIFSFLALSAQLKLDPSPIYVSGPASSPDIGAYVDVINESADTIVITWTRRVISSPPQWVSWICDLDWDICYPPSTGMSPASKPNTLAPGDTIQLQTHVNPLNVDGEAEIQLLLKEIDNPDDVVGLIEAHFSTETTSTFEIDEAPLKVYPNPATNYFKVTDHPRLERVMVYSIVGSPVKAFHSNPSMSYDISSLPQGIYFVRLIDQNQAVLKTIRLSKR